jgi:hypothetical protein
MAQAPKTPPREIRLTELELKDIVKATVHETLIKLGVDACNPIDMQRDFQHLRDWRMSVAAVRRKSLMTLVGVAVAGIAALIWMSVGGGKH